MEVDNAATQFGLDENLERVSPAKHSSSRSFGLSYQKLSPGFRMPFGHTHETQEEAYVVLNGGGRIKVGDDIVELKQWDTVRVPADVPRALEAGDDGMEILAIGAPVPDETEMLQNWWQD